MLVTNIWVILWAGPFTYRGLWLKAKHYELLVKVPVELPEYRLHYQAVIIFLYERENIEKVPADWLYIYCITNQYGQLRTFSQSSYQSAVSYTKI